MSEKASQKGPGKGSFKPRPAANPDQQRLLAKLQSIQKQTRERLIEELVIAEDMIDAGLFDAQSYSHLYEEYKYKYIERLDTLRRLIHELNVVDKTQRIFRTQLVVADSLFKLRAKIDAVLRTFGATSSLHELKIECVEEEIIVEGAKDPAQGPQSKGNVIHAGRKVADASPGRDTEPAETIDASELDEEVIDALIEELAQKQPGPQDVVKEPPSEEPAPEVKKVKNWYALLVTSHWTAPAN
ncbi:MAG: hypothetical protein NUW37_15870 [Planctomycetes bacterium]|nr:hypothetical protein [Planctomycetota bacterium]